MSEELSPLPTEDIQTEEELDIDEPKMYRVVLHNDDYTTMEFVVEVLMRVFAKPAAEATKIMLDVHNKGRGTVGIYTYDIATSKIDQVHKLAREHEFPLRCTCEPA